MYRVSYIGKNCISHKGNLKTEKDAKNWIEENKETITPLKLLMWNESTQCYDKTIEDFRSK